MAIMMMLMLVMLVMLATILIIRSVMVRICGGMVFVLVMVMIFLVVRGIATIMWLLGLFVECEGTFIFHRSWR